MTQILVLSITVLLTESPTEFSLSFLTLTWHGLKVRLFSSWVWLSRLRTGNLFCLCTPSPMCVLQTVAPRWQTVGYSPVTKHLLQNSWQSLPKINVRSKHKVNQQKRPLPLWDVQWSYSWDCGWKCTVDKSIWGHLRIKLIKLCIRKLFVLEPHLVLQKAVANVSWIEDCGIWKLVSHVTQVFKLGSQYRCDIR